jgi:predicted hydrocarbon binding protein
MGGSRRDFIKKSCLTGFCFCGLGGMNSLIASTGIGKEEDTEKESIHSKWITSLLLSLKDESPATARKIIKNRAEAHFDDLNLKEKFAPFVGKPELFYDFLKNEWGWILEYDKSAGIIIADENKDYCVCPLLKNKKIEGLNALCYCSEGMAEKMFSYVTRHEVKAEVVQSVLRGAKTCKYKITLL